MTHCISSWKGHTSSSVFRMSFHAAWNSVNVALEFRRSTDQGLKVLRWTRWNKIQRNLMMKCTESFEILKDPTFARECYCKDKGRVFCLKFASFAFFCALPMLFSICFQMHQSEMFTAPMCSQLELLRVVVEKGITFGWFMEGMEIQPPLQRWFHKHP